MTRGPHKILGIHNRGPIASAALIVAGEVAAGAAEERFTRKKADDSFPWQAASFCLGENGLRLADLDEIAIDGTAHHDVAIREALTAAGATPQIHYVDHHLAHARLAYHHSGAPEAAILVADARGDEAVTSIWHGKNGSLDRLAHQSFPESIGGFYAAITRFLGYRPMSDEWRVMGMAAYGRKGAVPELDRLIDLRTDGAYELDPRYFDFSQWPSGRFFSTELEQLLGLARKAGDKFQQRHFDIAAAAQDLFSRTMDHVLTHLYQRTGCDTVCLAGSVAMNCLHNGAVTRRTPFRRCSVSFAPDDSGNSIGAALEASVRAGTTLPNRPLRSAIGPAYSDEAIGEALERDRLPYRRVDDITAEAARLLAEGKIVGWFQGRGEFGQRALGHRSILASPLRADMKDRLNASVKYREAYRPFAPMLPLERVHEFFEDGEEVSFMEKALRFRDTVRDKVPAVVHADGTGRLQTVTKEEAPLLHRLLGHFGSMAGVPMLVNTSFNLNDEPIVGSPSDALQTFLNSGLDALAIGNFMVRKATS